MIFTLFNSHGTVRILVITHYQFCCALCAFISHFLFFFFFQAEDGIRDLTVTGVQTCALPISLSRMANDWSGLQELLKPASTMTFAEAAQAYMLERPLKHSSQLAYQDRLARLDRKSVV